MSEAFIIYRSYKDLSPIESLLISWVVQLNQSGKIACFTNEEASKMLKVSARTISNSISILKSKEYIDTFQIYGNRRIIKIVKLPEENVYHL